MTMAALTSEALASLKSSVRGHVITPDSSDYDPARAVWNGMIDTRPSLIVRCAGADDVVNAVRCARANRLRVSVRGGGHNVAGLALCDGAMLIDLSPMRAVHVDADRRTVRAEGGVTWGELDRQALAAGLGTTGGMVSTTGIAGLTLGGGLGWQMARHGLACDNLLSAEVVTASGDTLTVDGARHPELFWALRGGGGNFGIVTTFAYRLHEMPPTFPGGMVLYPIAQARDVLRFYREYAWEAPDDLTAHAGLMTTPDGIDVVAIMVAWFGAPAEADTRLAPLRRLGTPMADLIQPMDYVTLQTLFDPAVPHGIRRYWKSGYFPEISDDLIGLLIEHTQRKVSPLSLVLILHMHGKAAAVAPDATAFGARQRQWDFDILPQWRTPAEDSRNIEWARGFWREVEPFTRGVYSNHLDTDDGAPRVRAAYGGNYDRLVAAKQKYDPDNFFNVNNNIPPTPGQQVPRAARTGEAAAGPPAP